MGGPRDELIYTIRCCSPAPTDQISASVEDHLARCAAIRNALCLAPRKSLLLWLSYTSAAVLVLLCFAKWPPLVPIIGLTAFAGALAGRLARASARHRQDPGTWPRVPWVCRPAVSVCFMALVIAALLSARWDPVRIAWWVGGIGAALCLAEAASSRRGPIRPSARLPETPEEAVRAFADYLLPLAEVGALAVIGSVAPLELFARWRRIQAYSDRPPRAEDLASAWVDEFGHAKKIALRRAGATWREDVSVDGQPCLELHNIGPERAEGTVTLAMRCRLRDTYLWDKPHIDPDTRYLVRVEVVLCRLGDAWLVESPFPAEDARLSPLP